ncbi:hypothetical protein EC550_03200 [Helicobacter pylori]|nr:hypothetical protein EC550_03200 [Helicobacter pylori]
MRNYSLAYTSFFILIVKNPQRYQFDYQYSIKNFYRLYKMRWNVLRLCLTLSIAIFQRFLRNKTLS